MMYLLCELLETRGGAPVAVYDSDRPFELADLEGVLSVAGQHLRNVLAERDLDRELAARMHALCAELFPGEDIPPRKPDLWVVLPTTRTEVVIKLKGENAGAWATMGGAGPDNGGPLALIGRCMQEGFASKAATTPVGWAKKFLERQVATEAAETSSAAE